MALIQHLSPSAAKRLHDAGLLTEQATHRIAHRSRLVLRIWLAVALALAVTLFGFKSLTAKAPNHVSPQAQKSRAV